MKTAFFLLITISNSSFLSLEHWASVGECREFSNSLVSVTGEYIRRTQCVERLLEEK